MSCRNNGVVLNKRQIEILSRFIRNNKELGMEICSCDIQRVLDMNQPTKEESSVYEPIVEKVIKADNITVNVSVDIDTKKIGEQILKHVIAMDSRVNRY